MSGRVFWWGLCFGQNKISRLYVFGDMSQGPRNTCCILYVRAPDKEGQTLDRVTAGEGRNPPQYFTSPLCKTEGTHPCPAMPFGVFWSPHVVQCMWMLSVSREGPAKWKGLRLQFFFGGVW